MTQAASDHLLRTLAGVAPSATILDADCTSPDRLRALVQLGFSVYATTSDAGRLADLRSVAETELGDSSRAMRADTAALGFPDEFFDWIVLNGSHVDAASVADILDALSELRRVLKSGGWLFLVLPVASEADATTDEECLLGFYRLVAEARFELAERGVVETTEAGRLARAIFRRVDPGTPL